MIKKIGRDKWKHFFVGLVLGAILQASSWYFLPGNHLLSIGVAFLLLFAICYGFELFSLITGFGHYEFMDAVAGTIGGTLGILFILVITRIFANYTNCRQLLFTTSCNSI